MKTVKVKDVVDVFNGYAFKSSDYSTEGYQVIRIANVQDGYISNENQQFIQLKDDSLNRFILKEGEILISLTGNVGRVGKVTLNNLPAVLNQRVGKFLIKSDVILPDYLFNFFRSSKVQNQLIKKSKGIAQKNIGSVDIENLEIPLPDLEVQQKVIKILSQADSLRLKRKQTIELLDEYIKSVFLEMFGDIEKNPFGWDLLSLEQITKKITDGTHQPPKFVDEGIPFIFISNIINSEINLNTKKFISEKTYNELTKNTPIEKYDLLYTTVGSYGNPAIVKSSDKFCFQRHIAHIKPNHEKTNIYFLYGMLRSPSIKLQADKKAKGVAQKTLNLSDLKQFRVILPPFEVQNKFAKIVQDTEVLKQKMLEQSRELDNQFQALMQNHFRLTKYEN